MARLLHEHAKGEGPSHEREQAQHASGQAQPDRRHAALAQAHPVTGDEHVSARFPAPQPRGRTPARARAGHIGGRGDEGVGGGEADGHHS